MGSDLPIGRPVAATNDAGRTRQAIAAFLFSIGVLACVNDFGGIYFGTYIVVQMLGVVPTLAVCILFSAAGFLVGSERSTSRLTSTRNLVAWLALVAVIQGFFFVIGQSI